jgi:hypothetical protein
VESVNYVIDIFLMQSKSWWKPKGQSITLDTQDTERIQINIKTIKQHRKLKWCATGTSQKTVDERRCLRRVSIFILGNDPFGMDGMCRGCLLLSTTVDKEHIYVCIYDFPLPYSHELMHCHLSISLDCQCR